MKDFLFPELGDFFIPDDFINGGITVLAFKKEGEYK